MRAGASISPFGFDARRHLVGLHGSITSFQVGMERYGGAESNRRRRFIMAISLRLATSRIRTHGALRGELGDFSCV